MEADCGFPNTPQNSGAGLLVLLGPTILVDIGFDASYKPDAIPRTSPIASVNGIQALIDTGAQESCIDNQLATELGLPIVDRRGIAGAGGVHITNVYLAQISFPSLGATIYGPFCGVDLVAGGQNHKAFVGRTFLKNFVMVYDGTTGAVKISKPAPL